MEVDRKIVVSGPPHKPAKNGSFTNFTPTGLKNGETIGSTSVAYGTGAASTEGVNAYTGSVTLSAATGGTFNANNYAITYFVSLLFRI